MNNDSRPKVGIGVYVVKDDRVLMMQRNKNNAHAPAAWAPPGGHLEMNESFEECARREVREEVGIEIEHIRLMSATNDIYSDEGRHYVTLHLCADWKSGEARIMEPHKAQEVRWCSWDDLPEPLMICTRNFVETGYNPLNF